MTDSVSCTERVVDAALFDDLCTYLEEREDVRDGSDRPLPNEEMTLLMRLRECKPNGGLQAVAASDIAADFERQAKLLAAAPEEAPSEAVFTMEHYLADQKPMLNARQAGKLVRVLDADGSTSILMYPGTIADLARQDRPGYVASRSPEGSKPVPRWVTSWPEWFGMGLANVEVVPASDYEVTAKAMRTLFALLDRDLVYDHTGTVMVPFKNLDQAMDHIAEARRAAAVPRDDIKGKA